MKRISLLFTSCKIKFRRLTSALISSYIGATLSPLMQSYFGGGVCPISPPAIGGASSWVVTVPFEGEPRPSKAASIRWKKNITKI